MAQTYKTTTDFEPFICVGDIDGAQAYSDGFHSHDGYIYPVERLQFGYPLNDWYATGEDTTFNLPDRQHCYCTNLACLFAHIFRTMKEQNDRNALGGGHLLHDYCIERIHIDARGTATIQFGS